MTRELTCIMCPQGCDIAVTVEEGRVTDVSGNRCPKGRAYAVQELEHPMRCIATSVLVEGGTMPLASVRLNRPIPRERIFDAMACIRQVRVKAPVKAGTVLIPSILGLDSDVIVTRDVPEKNG